MRETKSLQRARNKLDELKETHKLCTDSPAMHCLLPGVEEDIKKQEHVVSRIEGTLRKAEREAAKHRPPPPKS